MAGAHGSTVAAAAAAVVAAVSGSHRSHMAHKRKRSADGSNPSHSDRIPQPPPRLSGTSTPINYLSKTVLPKLPLIEGDSGAFADILGLINEYEGVLSRHESLATNLGAKLAAPRLLRAMASLFEGSIKVIPQSPYGDSRASTWYVPSWADIVAFAKSNPGEFNLTTGPDGNRVCRFPMRNVQVEIGEDDWRLIVSGALDHFPALPPPEDDSAELATLDILEQRFQSLIMKADEIARKARQLNWHLGGRRAAIQTRRASTAISPGSGFQPSSQQSAANPATRYDIHADLLQQFLAWEAPPDAHPTMAALPVASQAVAISSLPSPSRILSMQTSRTPSLGNQPSLFGHTEDPSNMRDASLGTGPAEEGSGGYFPFIQGHIDRLGRGDRIFPPCDRCRRLELDCRKHNTACIECTHCHVRCSWKRVSEHELAKLQGQLATGRAREECTATATPLPALVPPGPGPGPGERENAGTAIPAPLGTTLGSNWHPPRPRGSERSGLGSGTVSGSGSSSGTGAELKRLLNHEHNWERGPRPRPGVPGPDVPDKKGDVPSTTKPSSEGIPPDEASLSSRSASKPVTAAADNPATVSRSPPPPSSLPATSSGSPPVSRPSSA